MRSSIILVVAAALFAGGAAFSGLVADPSSPDERGHERALQARAEIAKLRAVDLSTAFRNVARAVGPSVVSVSSKRLITPERSPLSRFFGEDVLRRLGRGDEKPVERPVALGTGVIATAEGHVVTNHHVVRGANAFVVTLADGRRLDATLVGADADTDLAVLHVRAPDLLPADFGRSAEVETGDWVLAVGNPFGLQHSVSAGIVSAVGRAGVGIAEYEHFIQTDAAINPGNSGGPLVDLRGRVIGINTAIASKTGAGLGIGFSIPSDMVRFVIDGIVAHGKVVRGWLGVYIEEGEGGVRVTGVADGGPAATAGLQAEDVILAVAGRTTPDTNALRRIVAWMVPGTKIPVTVQRGTSPIRVEVTLGDLSRAK